MPYAVINTAGQVIARFSSLVQAIAHARMYGAYTRVKDTQTGEWVRF